MDSALPKPAPFWETTALEEMTPAEWESLCDGCGRCCLVKLEDADTGAILATDIGCELLDAGTCRCKDYPNRSTIIPDCVTLTPESVRNLKWLPPTCAYRLVADGEPLKWWHPLVSGNSASVIAAGISVKGRVKANELDVEESDLAEHLVKWPLRWPKNAR